MGVLAFWLFLPHCHSQHSGVLECSPLHHSDAVFTSISRYAFKFLNGSKLSVVNCWCAEKDKSSTVLGKSITLPGTYTSSEPFLRCNSSNSLARSFISICHLGRFFCVYTPVGPTPSAANSLIITRQKNPPFAIRILIPLCLYLVHQ